MIKVSIIIPIFNGQEYIDKCLKTILSDKIKDIEVILINDGSEDNSLNILKNYQKKYKQIKIIDQKNSGQAVARNKGINLAHGEYIMFVDIDDYLEKNALYEMYNLAIKNKSDYVYSDYYEHYENKDIVKKNFYTKDSKKNALLINYAPWGKLISKELIDKIEFKFYEGKIFEDIAVIPYLAANANNPYYINKPLYYYNLTNNNSTIKTIEYKEKYEDIFSVSDYLYQKFKDNNLINKYFDELEFIYIHGILRANVMLFAKYKEGLKNISKLRKNVLDKFPNLKNNIYLKKEPLKNKIVTIVTLYFPEKLVYMIKRIVK